MNTQMARPIDARKAAARSMLVNRLKEPSDSSDKSRFEIRLRFQPPQKVTKPRDSRPVCRVSTLAEYVKVCEVADVPSGTMRPVDVGETRLMIVNVEGTLYAVDRICTHEEADLSTGFLNGSVVTCPLHLSRFDVKTGAVDNLPATVPLATYKLKIDGTSVYVRL